MPNDAIDLEQLFGSQSSCACEDCRNILSPAAYFVDTLMFLTSQERDVLFSTGGSSGRIRRPDLGEIQLSCANTDTPMPYIDLVNEVLEYAVAMAPAAPPTAPVGGWPQTTASADDLAVTPQNLIKNGANRTAYDALARTLYAWSLPFDLPQEQVRGYLGAIQLERDVLMQAFRAKLRSGGSGGSGGAGGWDPTDAEIACESLAISPLERRLITDRASMKSVRAATTASLANLKGPQTVDGVGLVAGDRVLVKNQGGGASHKDNGVYVVQASDWVRPPDADAKHLHDGALVPVAEGGQKDTSWVLTTPDPLDTPFSVGTDPLKFEKFVSAGVPNSSGFGKGDAWGLPSPVDANAWTKLTTQVKTFLETSGLGYDDLVELLETRFINPAGTQIQFPKRSGGGNVDELTCDIDGATFVPALDEGQMNRIPRFVRLARKLGWSFRTLERAVRTFLPLGAGNVQPEMTDAFLKQVATAVWLGRALGLEVAEALAFWSNLDTLPDPGGVPSLYDRLFLNSAVLAADANATFQLKSDRTELANATDRITSHVPGVLAGLDITAPDLALLVSTAGLADVLNLANLSALYRRTRLAKALDLSIRDFVTVQALAGIDPFDAAHTNSTRELVTIVRKIKASGFSIADLDWILRNVSSPAGGVAPSLDAIRVTLSEIQVGLQKIAADTSAAVDPTGEITRTKLASLFPNPNPSSFIEDAIAFVASAGLKDASGANVADPTAFITAHFPFLDPADALKNLVTSPLPSPADRFSYVLSGYQSSVRGSLSESFVEQKLAAALGLDTKVLTIVVRMPGTTGRKSSSRSAIAEYLDPAFSTSLLPSARDAAFVALAAVRTYFRLAKIARLLRKFRVTVDRLGTDQTPDWLLRYGPLDVKALPLDGPPSDSTLFEAWLRLLDFFSVWNGIDPGGMSLFAILDLVNGNAALPNSVGDFLTILSRGTGWSFADLQTLVGTTDAFGYKWPDDFADGTFLAPLNTAFSLLKQAGVSAAQVLGWIVPEVDGSVAAEVRQAAKAQIDASNWTQVAKPIQDGLRQRQRDALVAYLISQGGFAGTNQVYEWFLIDPEMSACMLTSRIKQAIGSVQLFIQRSILNLESGINLGKERTQEWVTWRKSYRVWEAARKVFLYPENWILPELRDDKSPFFKEFETEIQQKDLTLDSAEEAFRHYLEKLEDVARLEISAMFHDREAEIIHVLGRSFGTPHVHWYRNYRGGAWSAWEKVNVDVAADQVALTVHHRRLFLIWPLFKAKQNNSDGKDMSTHLEVQIAWSQYKNGRWTAKKISPSAQSQVIQGDPDGQDRPYADFSIKAFELDAAVQTPGGFAIDLPAEEVVGQGAEPGDLIAAVFRFFDSSDFVDVGQTDDGSEVGF